MRQGSSVSKSDYLRRIVLSDVKRREAAAGTEAGFGRHGPGPHVLAEHRARAERRAQGDGRGVCPLPAG